MGTRALTVFQNKNEEEIAVLFRQYDGYPEVHGKDIFNFLYDSLMVNGIPLETKRIVFNGIEDLTCRLITYLKNKMENKAGNFYLYPANTRDIGEEYIYFLSIKNEKIWLKVFDIKYTILYDNFLDNAKDFIGNKN